MNLQQIYECERKQLDKYHLTLPHIYKQIGLGIAFVSLLLLLVARLLSEDMSIIKIPARHGILIGLLLIALAKEKIEDELIAQLRARAFSFAFVAGVIYTVVQPYINYVVAIFVRPEKANFTELSPFMILWFMLVIYLGIFSVLKKTR